MLKDAFFFFSFLCCLFASKKKKNNVRISGRAKRGITRETGLNLGKIFQKIGPIINGEGGGHQNAAACNGTTNLNAGLKEILTLIEKDLKNLNVLKTDEVLTKNVQ